MSFWQNKRVLITGHTGFKGSWLSLWLEQLGAELCGIALEPPTDPSLFKEARVAQGMRSEIADIRDLERVKEILREHRPEVIFHMAAQPLVRKSYDDPVGTYSTNVMGTVNLLESVRGSDSVRAVVIITTDKCYENKEWVWPYRETDRLGGYDTYSNSKACAELVVAAYRSSFFNPSEYSLHGVSIASVRAGNVIGGGDWAEGRLIPDIMRAFMTNRPVEIRNPHATRPWQHVLEPLRGYIAVGEALCNDGTTSGEAWNFGPEQQGARPVAWIVKELAELWGDVRTWKRESGSHPHEAQSLKLDCSKAEARLGWRPVLQLKDALAMTASWYQARSKLEDMHIFTCAQIQQYEKLFKFKRQEACD